MNSLILNTCERFIRNRDTLKAVNSWDSGLQHVAGAMILTLRGADADGNKLLGCKKLIKESFGVFSSFRGNALTFATAMLSTADDPVALLRDTSVIYKALRGDFYSSDYLPIAAMMIAITVEPYDHSRIISRMAELYRLIRAEHPFLTSSEDTLFCSLLAMANRSNADLIRDMETCYETIKPQVLARNPLQSLSQLLALSTVAPAEKCERVMAFYNAFRAHGRRYGLENEFAALGALSMTGATPDAAIPEIIEIDDWLASQHGFGFFSSVSKRHRLMLSTALYTYVRLYNDGDVCDDDRAITEMMSMAVIFAILSAIIAQQQSSTAAAT